MTKLNYKIDMSKQDNDKEKERKLNKSLYSLSKQEVINGSLASMTPQNPNGGINNQNMIKTNGFGRTV